jgi:hypothetical protein
MWGSEGIVPPFLTSALDGGEWSTSRPGRFTPGTHWIEGWLGPRAGLDTMEKRLILTLPAIEHRLHPIYVLNYNFVPAWLEVPGLDKWQTRCLNIFSALTKRGCRSSPNSFVMSLFLCKNSRVSPQEILVNSDIGAF